jgi:hypothetical protein
MLRHFRLLPLAAAFLAAAAAAQSSAPAPSAADPGTPSTPLAYRSPLAGYQAFTEENVISWSEANDTVGRIGGWREYARESARPASPAEGAAPAAPDAPVRPGGHGGHQH